MSHLHSNHSRAHAGEPVLVVVSLFTTQTEGDIVDAEFHMDGMPVKRGHSITYTNSAFAGGPFKVAVDLGDTSQMRGARQWVLNIDWGEGFVTVAEGVIEWDRAPVAE